MAYSHADNIGNEGDLIKHAVLAAAVDQLLSTWNPTREFQYVESHAGAAEYELSTAVRRSWSRGVGRIVQQCSDSWPAPLHAYRDAAFNDHLSGLQQASSRTAWSNERLLSYPGSSELVHRLLRGRGVLSRFTLFDVDATVCHDLATHFPDWERVRVRREDGLLGVLAADAPSFVLIDPPDLSQSAAILEIAAKLEAQGTAFMIWTSRSPGRFGDGWREGQPSTNCFDATSMYCRVRARWSDWGSQGIKGCQLTLSPTFNDAAQQAAASVRELLEWSED